MGSEIKNVCKILVGKPELKESVMPPKRKKRESMKQILENYGIKFRAEAFFLQRGPVRDCCEHDNATSASVTVEYFLDYQRKP
jgi:hypothetical protein